MTYRLVNQLLCPYTLLSLIIAVGLIHVWWRGRETRGRLCVLTVPFVLLQLLSLPVVHGWAFATLDFLPSPGAARGTQEVVHEWLGLAWYWLHGRI